MDTASPVEEPVFLVLETLGFAVMLLDDRGRVLRTNSKAKRYLGSHLDFQHKAEDHGENLTLAQLQTALRNALRDSSKIAPQLGEVIAVPRVGKRPLLLRTIHLIGSTIASADPRLSALVLVDLEDCPKPGPELLKRLFGLTPAESRLARHLSCGEDLETIAEACGVTVGTLRMYLKSVFWKTGTRRQAELAALLSRVTRLDF